MSRFLIDTNVLVHFLEEVLDEHTYELLRDYANQIYISSVSVMEFINLVQSGRVKNHKFGKEKVLQLITEKLYFKVLYVAPQHLEELERLPSVPNHNDPNDRLIISQALSNRLELVSSDSQFVHYRKYGLEFIKAKHTAKKK